MFLAQFAPDSGICFMRLGLQAPIIRAIAFNLCAAAVWPLLPLFARDVLKTSATGYGLLLGAFGLGSIASAMALPRLRSRFALDRILAMGAVLGAAAFFGLSLSTHPLTAGALLIFVGRGVGWRAGEFQRRRADLRSRLGARPSAGVLSAGLSGCACV